MYLKENLFYSKMNWCTYLLVRLLLDFLLQSTSVPVNYLQAIVKSIGSGLGFGVVGGVLFTTIRYRLEIAPIPQSFKGLPIALITAGLLAMAFLGFNGLHIKFILQKDIYLSFCSIQMRIDDEKIDSLYNYINFVFSFSGLQGRITNTNKNQTI